MNPTHTWRCPAVDLPMFFSSAAAPPTLACPIILASVHPALLAPQVMCHLEQPLFSLVHAHVLIRGVLHEDGEVLAWMMYQMYIRYQPTQRRWWGKTSVLTGLDKNSPPVIWHNVVWKKNTLLSPKPENSGNSPVTLRNSLGVSSQAALRMHVVFLENGKTRY